MVDSTMTVDGEIAAFMRAVGSEIYSPEHLAVIALAGPAMESHEDQRSGAQWQYQVFSRTGVTLQFKDGLMVGALIRLQGVDGDPAYPSPEQLIAGLLLPTSRESAEAYFGKPRQSSPNMDLYLVDDRYLRFDFESDLSATVTVVLPEVGV